ncbi:hypothetical protein BATDEDRAFT_93069 [Batrachochytrium dendrobatidis JAM81]|uniref:Uncharacterized protein n=1 Tax=Batrachochytrium dendrobatidis (strain JAM81 / FGSC 10211) TaxID=684364 RepID=F4PFC2_BATDJ|nr:uncharacterized protein BATDEDRAFT_93069 [Batrachochytrium dendrobatidis JAM81]EGF76071.1 hypothetical protein BATDEDRAFT_93069 [Batrachochytrium dendrobatidis JAM81]|eukprot:XP_006683307.1 hypothetical protein BATDEDRAFT_93069 [Batrachochytrium dendrobatidis JAM81]
MYGSSSSQKHVRSLKDMDNNRNKDTDTLQSSSHSHLSATSPIPLSRELLGQFQVARVFKDNSRHITSIDFDADGYSCVTASEDESIRIYDVRSGKSRNCIYSKKYGCALARFTHRSTNIIYASTKEDDALRYMSLHDNKYLRYYKGHKKRVVSLVMSPQDDSVLSASLDDTVRFWDLRSPNCQGPFATFPIKDPITLDFAAEWTHMSFSNDGKLILISTTSNVMYIVDAFNGGIKHRLTGHMNQMGMAFEACFTPDAEFVIGGSQDGKIHYWEVETGNHIHALEWHHEPPKVVAFNPKHLMFASADTNLAFWIPSM